LVLRFLAMKRSYNVFKTPLASFLIEVCLKTQHCWLHCVLRCAWLLVGRSVLPSATLHRWAVLLSADNTVTSSLAKL
jgi:hypothetical protein